MLNDNFIDNYYYTMHDIIIILQFAGCLLGGYMIGLMMTSFKRA